VGGQRHAPVDLLTGITRCPLYRKIGEPPGPVWMGVETRPNRDAIPGPSKTVASRYTDWAIQAHQAIQP
jgi:hypothetical protein